MIASYRKWILAWLLLLILSFVGSADFAASRRPVRAKHAMVVSAEPLASQVGVEILRQGGNAVDAAVATGFALAVVYPQAGNLGGGGFMVIRFTNGQSTTFDFREKAPLKASRNMYLDKDGKVIAGLSTFGCLACGVPGTVAGFYAAHQKYGRLPWKTVVAPAINLAQQGFRVSSDLSRALQAAEDNLRRFPPTAQVFLNQGRSYLEGEKLVQKDLARTLELIAKNGRDGFYRGPIADCIVATMQRCGGLISYEDLLEYQAVEREPVRGNYRGYEIISMGPPSSGGICLIELLNIVEGFDLEQLGYHSSAAVHCIVEAMKRVYADRAKYLGDADFYPVPVAGLLSKAYADSLRRCINLQKVTPSETISHGFPWYFEGSQTTHYSVVDADGMAVAVTTTLNSSFGAKVVVENAGFLLNNEMDDFSAKPGVPNIYGLVGGEANAIAPGKRMLSSMTPTIVTQNGHLQGVLGTPGGSTIITTVFQIIINIVDYGMDVQEAVDAPRFHHQWLPDILYFERYAFPQDVIGNLQRLGHHCKQRKGYSGNAQVIWIDSKTQELLGASDPRGYGAAVGY